MSIKFLKESSAIHRLGGYYSLIFKSFIKDLTTTAKCVTSQTVALYLWPVTRTCPVVHIVYKMTLSTGKK